MTPGQPPGALGPHIDGIPTSLNGVPADGRIHGFTVLAGILLSDMDEPGHGNLTVWAGSHLAMARWFAEHGTRIPDPDAFIEAAARVAYGTAEPVAVTGRAGDLVLAHHLLVHSSGGHAGPGIRYAAYFRLSTAARDDLGDAVVTDPWAEWDAMRS